MDLFKGRHFDQQVIILCVRWYLSYKLSSRDLAQMMRERGIEVAHTTILKAVTVSDESGAPYSLTAQSGGRFAISTQAPGFPETFASVELVRKQKKSVPFVLRTHALANALLSHH